MVLRLKMELMIKFFRKIRQKLVVENRFNKYLLYAIGEIILVVIGILIALQINNWNEDRKEENLRENYYQQLLSDLDKDKNSINFNIKRLELNIEAHEKYRSKLKEPNLPLDTIYKYVNKIDFRYGAVSFNAQTFNILESTGGLKLFKTDFRNALMALNTMQLDYDNLSKENNLTYVDVIKMNPLAFKDSYIGDVKNQPNLYNNYNEETLAQNLANLNHALKFKYFNETQYIIRLTNILNQIEELERMIDKEFE